VLEIWSGHAMVSTPRLVLVHNEQRLPLDPHDGRQILVAQGPTHPGQWTVLERFDAEPSKPGFFRLFADVDPAQPRQFAVLDPPLDYLRGAP
jgi:hypothetical protein